MAGTPQTSLGAYSIVFVAAIASLFIPALLWMIARWVGPEYPRKERQTASDRTELGIRFNFRFFQASLIGVSLIGVLILLLPLAVNLHAGVDSETLEQSLVGVLSLAGVVGLCLLYSERKRDLNWLKTYRDQEVDKT